VERASAAGISLRRESAAVYGGSGFAPCHGLLRRDVDYLVKNGAIESVDEFKGASCRQALARRSAKRR